MKNTEPKTTHTPGPWLTIGNAIFGGKRGEIEIGEVYPTRDDADRRLIAAAPELLAALEECITTPGALAERAHTFAMARLKAITRVAREAIAKATGQN